MKSTNRPISKKDVEELDEFLAAQDLSEEYEEHQNVVTVRQYISRSCYGHDLRQCDIPLPRIPKCCLDQGAQDAVSSVVASQSEAMGPMLKWSVLPPDVVQLRGLPTDCNVELWRDVVANHGTILQSEVQKTNRETFLRFKLMDSASCDWLVANIDNVDVLGSGHKIKCTHLKP